MRSGLSHSPLRANAISFGDVLRVIRMLNLSNPEMIASAIGMVGAELKEGVSAKPVVMDKTDFIPDKRSSYRDSKGGVPYSLMKRPLPVESKKPQVVTNTNVTELPPAARQMFIERDAAPDPLTKNLVFSFQKTNMELPGPLFNKGHQRNILRELCYVSSVSEEIDTDAILKQLSRGEPLPLPLPLRSKRRLARTIHIFRDGNSRMTFFASDANVISDTLRKQTNAGVVVRYWKALEEVAAQQMDNTERPDPLVECDDDANLKIQANDVVLLLSDLGFGKWGREERWRLTRPKDIERTVERITAAKANAAALLPVNPRRWQNVIPRALKAAYWDRSTRTSGIGWKKAKTGEPASGEYRLSLACFNATRVTPRILRELRRTLFPHAGPEWEAEAWYGRYLRPNTSGYAEINRPRLEETQHEAVSWTRLMALMQQAGRDDLLRNPALARQSCSDVPDEDPTNPRPPYRPADWNVAQLVVAEALRSDGKLYNLLTSDRCSGWKQELDHLRNGEGCVFIERAQEILRINAIDHPLDRYESQLLWAAYEDSVAPTAQQRVKELLAHLGGALTDAWRGDEREAAFSWLGVRRETMPASIRQEQGWTAALLQADSRRRPARSAPYDTKIWDRVIKGDLPSHYIRLPRCDVHAMWTVDRGWRLALEPPGGRQAYLRFRAPGQDTVLLFVQEAQPDAAAGLSPHGESVTVYPGSPVDLPHKGAIDVITLAGDRFRLQQRGEEPARSFDSWMEHEKAERASGDWTAASRWAEAARTKAARTPLEKYHSGLRLAEAVIVTEEPGIFDRAVALVNKLVPDLEKAPAEPAWDIRRLRLAQARMSLLAVDSRLEEALAIGDAALQVADSRGEQYRVELAAALAQARSLMLALLERTLDMRRATPIMSALEADLTLMDASSAPLRVQHRAMGTGFARLVRFYILTGQIQEAQKAHARAADLLEKTQDTETRYACLAAQSDWAAYFEPARKTIALLEEMLSFDSKAGRVNRTLLVGRDLARIQFNTGRPELAQCLINDFFEIAMRRRSKYVQANLLREILYQSTQNASNKQISVMESMRKILPVQERLLEIKTLIDNDRYNKAPSKKLLLDFIKTQVHFMHECGCLEHEATSLYKMIDIASDFFTNSISGIKLEFQDRALILCRMFQNSLHGTNLSDSIASRLLVPSDDSAIREQAIEMLWTAANTCEHIEVFDGVTLYLGRIVSLLINGDCFNRDTAYGQFDFDRAQTVISRALEFEDKATPLAISRIYSLRSDICLRTGDLKGARADGLRALDLAREDNYLPHILYALDALARIAIARASWANALDYFEEAVREILRHRPFYEYMGGIDASALGDILDQRALKSIQGTENAETPSPEAASASDDGHGSEDFHRTALLAQIPRAGRIYRDYLIATGQHAGEKALPFNDFWYWGEALFKAGAPEAMWFLQAAIYHQESGVPKDKKNGYKSIVKFIKDKLSSPPRKLPSAEDNAAQRIKQKIESLRQKHCTQPNLDYDPNITDDDIASRYNA